MLRLLCPSGYGLILRNNHPEEMTLSNIEASNMYSDWIPWRIQSLMVDWCDNMTGVFVDGKWQTIYGIHTDPSWELYNQPDGRLNFRKIPNMIRIIIPEKYAENFSMTFCAFRGWRISQWYLLKCPKFQPGLGPTLQRILTVDICFFWPGCFSTKTELCRFLSQLLTPHF